MNTGVKVAIGVTVGAVAGVAVANYLTDGAVLATMKNAVSNIKATTVDVINSGADATEEIRAMAEGIAKANANA